MICLPPVVSRSALARSNHRPVNRPRESGTAAPTSAWQTAAAAALAPAKPAVSVVTAMVVVTLGAIPFVGLVVPNLTTRLTGDNLRQALPLTALFGAVLVLAADVLGRVIRAPYEVPVATTIAVIGATAFVILLNRGRSGV